MKRILPVILLLLGASPFLSAQRVLQQRLTTADTFLPAGAVGTYQWKK